MGKLALNLLKNHRRIMPPKTKGIAHSHLDRRFLGITNHNPQISRQFGIYLFHIDGGGIIPSSKALTESIPSMAPAAPSRCPVMDLVALTLR